MKETKTNQVNELSKTHKTLRGKQRLSLGSSSQDCKVDCFASLVFHTKVYTVYAKG